MWKNTSSSFSIFLASLLVACSNLHTNTKNSPKEKSALTWRCPTVSYERHNPDGSIDYWVICAVEVGPITVRKYEGAIIPLGEIVSHKDIGKRSFEGYGKDEIFTSESVKLVSYKSLSDASKIAVGYEVSFPDCHFDNFILFIKDRGEDGALEALDYVFNKMKLGSLCI